MYDNDVASGSDLGRALSQAGSIGKKFLAQQIDERSTAAGGRLSDVSTSIMEMSEDIRKRGQATWIGDIFDYAAAYCDRAGSYLKDSNGDALARDFESYTQAKPAVVAALALGTGFALARVLRVSALPGDAISAAQA